MYTRYHYMIDFRIDYCLSNTSYSNKAVISVTLGSEYVYKDGNKTCIEVKSDVKFTLTNGNKTVQFDGTDFTVKSGDCALPGEEIASLSLTNAKDDSLTLMFRYDKQNQSMMDVLFNFAPFEYFPESPTPNQIQLIDNGDLILGEYTQLFNCTSLQRTILNGQLEDIKYTMYMDLYNTQIQAFDMMDGNLSSNVFVCSADQMTTSAQNASTEPVTTAPSTNTTTDATTATSDVTTQASPTTTNTTAEAPTTNTTVETTTMANTTMEGPTTTPTTAPTTVAPTPPMPPVSKYKVKVGGKVCLIMEGSFQLMVTMNKTTVIDVPPSEKVNVTGMCATGNETESSITITPTSGPLKSLTFDFKINMETEKSELVSMSAEVMVDGKSVSHSVNKTLILSNPKLFFKCDVGGNIMDEVVTFKYEQLKVQAFNVEDEKFADNGEDCSKDVDPIPAPGSPPVNKYSVTEGNKTCIVFNGAMKFTIPYLSKKGNSSEVVAVPEKFNVSGTCETYLFGKASQKLEVKFYDDWKLTIYFTDTNNKTNEDENQLTADASGDYYISQIELEYEFNNNLFVDADESILGTKANFTAYNLTELKTSNGNSYMCNTESSINLNSKNGFGLTVSKLQYQAFKTGKSTDFGDASECAADEETNSIVPIAVGAALAGLVIIVLIAYLIGRKRSRAGYEQV